jgi:hypothetical protein
MDKRLISGILASDFSSVRVSMTTSDTTDKDRAYRRRLASKGRRQLIVDLPQEMIETIDELKQQRGLRSRSQVLMELIERGSQPTQQIA